MVFVAVSQLNHESIADKDVLLDEITNAAIEVYPDFVEACVVQYFLLGTFKIMTGVSKKINDN
ncbi:MAG: hypothetical protein ABH836_05910 [Candidatus Omnitrophota bacterium]